MKVERSIRCALVLSVAFVTISFAQTVSGREASEIIKNLQTDEVDTLQPPAPINKKGTAHVGCAYLIYLTVQSTLQVCFPNQYIALRRHVDKWVPIMRKYADDNAIQEEQKFGTDNENRGMANFRQNLDAQHCEKARPSMEQFSKILTDDLTKTEQGMERMLQQADEPGQHYGCL